MLEKRSIIDRCIADLEMAQKIFSNLADVQGTLAEHIHKAAVEKKKLEVKLAAAKLAEAEYYLAALNARLDFLEIRCAAANGATRREEEELAWARDARPINAATVTRLAAELEQRKAELETMLSQSQQAA